MSLTFLYEQPYWQRGSECVIGVDEVGRGAFAGPVVSAAVAFRPEHTCIDEVYDSKKVSRTAREKVSQQIKSLCMGYAIGEASVSEINQLGIVQATFLAMQRAVSAFKSVEHVFVDGILKPSFDSLTDESIECIVKGDQKCYSIAAASILAKVHRDEVMRTLHLQHPAYHWHSNVGYGTRVHRQAIESLGICEHHRQAFTKNYS